MSFSRPIRAIPSTLTVSRSPAPRSSMRAAGPGWTISPNSSARRRAARPGRAPWCSTFPTTPRRRPSTAAFTKMSSPSPGRAASGSCPTSPMPRYISRPNRRRRFSKCPAPPMWPSSSRRSARPIPCPAGASASPPATAASSPRWRASSPISTTAPSRRSRSPRPPRSTGRRTAWRRSAPATASAAMSWSRVSPRPAGRCRARARPCSPGRPFPPPGRPPGRSNSRRRC